MKTRNRCGGTKPKTEFNRKSARRLQGYCRDCNKEYLRQHYRDNKQYYLEKALRFRDQIKAQHYEKLFRYFAEHPCVDCGEVDPAILQFDHVRRVKLTEVGRLVSGGYPWVRVAAEIEKCEVRCADCHRRRTARQFGWTSYAQYDVPDGG